jgi:ferritin-like metal-binding protein YciE
MATATMDSTMSDAAIQAYVAGVQNAHSLEKQATQLIDRQLERVENYPEVAALLQQHKVETERQIERLDAILADLGSGPSTLKDVATMITGNLAAIGHTVMPDEVMKNHFANAAFEAFEITTYKSLIAMAEATGHQGHIAHYEQSLSEEQATEAKLQAMTAPLTQKFLSLAAAGESAKR